MIKQKVCDVGDQVGLAPPHTAGCQASYLISLNLSFLICEVLIIRRCRNFMWIQDPAVCVKSLGQHTAPSASSMPDGDYFFNNI